MQQLHNVCLLGVLSMLQPVSFAMENKPRQELLKRQLAMQSSLLKKAEFGSRPYYYFKYQCDLLKGEMNELVGSFPTELMEQFVQKAKIAGKNEE